MPKLISLQQAHELSIESIHDYYLDYVNPGQVKLIATFGFGNDLVDHAQGEFIFLKNGRTIMDFTGGVGVLNHGHNHPRILAARKAFNEAKRMEVHKNYFSPYVAALSHNIAQLMPEDLKISYFPNSGAESVEGAMKMAYKYHDGKRDFILHSDISFHGKLLGSASITGSPEVKYKFQRIPNTQKFGYNDIESVKSLVKSLRKQDGTSNIYSIILEPFNASSLTPSSESFLKELREICNKEDIVLIFDEVYTSWGKTGHLFNFMKYNVIPDIVTYAKSFGGGKASISGFTTRKRVFEKAYGNLEDSIIHSTTYNGFGEETATAVEAVNTVIEENFVQKARDIHAQLSVGLNQLKEKYPDIVLEVRGEGALMGLKFPNNFMLIKQIAQKLPSKMLQDERFTQKLITGAIISHLYNEHGILTFYGSNREIVLVLSPSLVTKKESIDHLLKSLDETLSKGLISLMTKFVIQKFKNS